VFVCVALEFELRALCLLGRVLSHESLYQSFFMLGISEIGSLKLCVWAGFKPILISASRVAKFKGASHYI
jgi:hypothetical protein